MATRRRSNPPVTVAAASPPPSASGEPPLAPSKLGIIIKFSLIFFIPYIYLILFHYKIEDGIMRPIFYNFMMSFVGFLVTMRFIPIASGYLRKRNMFGFDINKKGTPAGEVKV